MPRTHRYPRRAWWLPAAAAGAALVWRLRRGARMDFAHRVVVITGGSRGLGLALARRFAAEGARVVLLARTAQDLDRARDDLARRGFSAFAVPCDVRDRRQVDEAIAAVAAEHGAIDVLLNVAGIIQVGPFAHMELEDFGNAMDTHFWGPLHTIRAALPHLRRSAVGRIVNVSSIGGRIAVPHLLPYSASKFALTGLSTGLHAELAREGIRVTTVCPGMLRTGSTWAAGFKGRHQAEFAWFHASASMPLLSAGADRAARQIVEACRRGAAMLVITPPARLAAGASGVVPAAVARIMTAANALLPAPADASGDAIRTGRQSFSRFVPSLLTRLADRAVAAHNELPAAGRPLRR
jgi:NAD(P)-dependent dehydrogenase (short-subunit alcohol dehydrogenase family)